MALATCALSRQEGKITPTVFLFKGKRSITEPRPPSDVQEEVGVAGSVYFGDDGQVEDEEAPDWLAGGIESGEPLAPENGSDLDVPPEDVGQKKPFKF